MIQHSIALGLTTRSLCILVQCRTRADKARMEEEWVSALVLTVLYVSAKFVFYCTLSSFLSPHTVQPTLCRNPQ